MLDLEPEEVERLRQQHRQMDGPQHLTPEPSGTMMFDALFDPDEPPDMIEFTADDCIYVCTQPTQQQQQQPEVNPATPGEVGLVCVCGADQETAGQNSAQPTVNHWAN